MLKNSRQDFPEIGVVVGVGVGLPVDRNVTKVVDGIDHFVGIEIETMEDEKKDEEKRFRLRKRERKTARKRERNREMKKASLQKDEEEEN